MIHAGLNFACILPAMTEYKDRLAQAMKNAGAGTQQLADGMGITYQAVKRMLDGKSAAFSAPNNAKAAQFLQVNSDWLATGEGDMTTNRDSNVAPGPRIRGSVPLLSSVQAGAFKEILDSNYSGGDGVVMIPTTVPVNRYTFALRVQGDSMEPRFTEGMLLIVEPELDGQHGDYVIVKNGSNETTFKQLVKDGSDWFLKPLNPRYPIKSLGADTIVGVVRGVTEQFR